VCSIHGGSRDHRRTGEQSSGFRPDGREGDRKCQEPVERDSLLVGHVPGVGVKIIPQSGTKKTERGKGGKLAAKGVRDAVAGNSGHNNHFSARGDTVGPRWASGSLDMNAPHGHTALMGTGRRTAEGDKAEAVPCNAQYNRPLGAKRQHSATEERRRREHRRMACAPEGGNRAADSGRMGVNGRGRKCQEPTECRPSEQGPGRSSGA
jgi:hypothetical protein